MNPPRYNIRAVERATGVPAATLRSWERRYGFPAPDRSATARRLFSDGDIHAIRWVKGQIERGLSVAQAVRQVPPASPPTTAAWPRGEGADLLVDSFVRAAAHYDEAAAEAVLAAALARFPADVVLTDVIAAALIEIGERWARGELAVGAEHFASGLVRRRLLSMLAQMSEIGPAPRVVLACVPEEQHEIGLMMLTLFLRWAGLHVVSLGANVPAADIVRCLRHTGADAVCLSAIHAGAAAGLAEVVQTLRDAGVAVPVFAGGPEVRAELTPGLIVPDGDLRQATDQIARVLRAA